MAPTDVAWPPSMPVIRSTRFRQFDPSTLHAGLLPNFRYFGKWVCTSLRSAPARSAPVKSAAATSAAPKRAFDRSAHVKLSTRLSSGSAVRSIPERLARRKSEFTARNVPAGWKYGSECRAAFRGSRRPCGSPATYRLLMPSADWITVVFDKDSECLNGVPRAVALRFGTTGIVGTSLHELTQEPHGINLHRGR
jgi:hypothetical protein